MGDLTPIRVPKAFKRRLRKKTPEMQKKVQDAVEMLRRNPKHPGLRTHRVQGNRGVYEARLDDGNRITFHWDDEWIVLRNNCNHDILKRP